jgi:hypothetical protein
MVFSLEQDQKQDDDHDERAEPHVHGYLPRQSRHHALPASAASGMNANNPITNRTTMVKSR